MTETRMTPSQPTSWALIVEDYGPMRRLLGRLLADAFRIREAESCEAALELMRHQDPPFDVVLLDIGFPEGQLQGDHALRHIKQEWPGQVVVVVSVHDEDDVVRACQEAGAADYVCKEIRDPNLLAYRVVRAVELERYHRALRSARQGTTDWEHAPLTGPLASPVPRPSLHVRPLEIRPLDEVLREEVELALEACGGNLPEAARRLHVDLIKLRQLMVLMGLEGSRRGKA